MCKFLVNLLLIMVLYTNPTYAFQDGDANLTKPSPKTSPKSEPKKTSKTPSRPSNEVKPDSKGDLDETSVKSKHGEKPSQPGLTVRLHTSVPNCDMFINGNPQGYSDDQGLFNYVTNSPAILVEARKSGYLSTNKSISVTPDVTNKEILLTLDPIPASVIVSGNVEEARVQIDDQSIQSIQNNQSKLYKLNEKISVAPGLYKVTVNALGYTPFSYNVTLGPGDNTNKAITLEKLPIPELSTEAERCYNNRSYSDVLLLCKYIFEENAAYAPAHRLAGAVYLAQQDYTKAEQHFGQALKANENIKLRVRRHARESFDVNKSHDTCEAFLILTKDHVEFQGVQVSTDNFKVAYNQLQLLGIQLQKATVVYLNTKVTDSRGNKKDFNFYSFDKELSQSGRGYLEMLQHLLKAH